MSEVQGRIYFEPEEVHIEVWSYEFDPPTPTSRTTGEWANEYLWSLGEEDLRKLFGVKTDYAQAIFKGKMSGSYDYWGEFDDDFELLECEVREESEDSIAERFPNINLEEFK